MVKVYGPILVNLIEERENLEEESVRLFWFNYLIHNYLIKKIFKFSSKILQEELIKLIKYNPKRILDVSCGDDDFIVKICDKYNSNICIANDLSIKLSSIIKDKKTKVQYTNFNILYFPFKDKFDLVVCKNTLHHIPKQFQVDLIKYLLRISRQLLIVDIEDPRDSLLRAKLWNLYYRLFLGDKGEFFLNNYSFKKLLISSGISFNVGEILTLKGKYLYAYYSGKSKN